MTSGVIGQEAFCLRALSFRSAGAFPPLGARQSQSLPGDSWLQSLLIAEGKVNREAKFCIFLISLQWQDVRIWTLNEIFPLLLKSMSTLTSFAVMYLVLLLSVHKFMGFLLTEKQPKLSVRSPPNLLNVG